jgi:hypothetical protein
MAAKYTYCTTDAAKQSRDWLDALGVSGQEVLVNSFIAHINVNGNFYEVDLDLKTVRTEYEFKTYVFARIFMSGFTHGEGQLQARFRELMNCEKA